MNLMRILLFLGLLLLSLSCVQKKEASWPAQSNVTKPWTRWWWHGSALTKEGITIELEAYAKAGLGGVEITPIYGVKGAEAQFVSYLSPEWVDLLIFTLAEAKRLDLGVDMATGTGWPFGGPWIDDNHSSRNVYHKVYELSEGQSLKEKIEFIQQPLLRTVLEKADINKLVQPISANKDLQVLAIDQVQFKRSIPFVSLIAVQDSMRFILTDKVKNGKLDWIAPKGKWKLHAVFSGWHGKMVERAGPGGEGNVIDHFSGDALQHYLNRFDSAFKDKDLTSLRAFFNDSYEVDDAQGAANWTPDLLHQFELQRRYKLEDHFDKLFSNDSSDETKGVLYDYRLTLSELLQEQFTQQWTLWASTRVALTRNQAHGSPANILDLYSVVDIPEIEGTEPLRIRMASSAGNVSGKPFVSSESATWLDEHFQSSLGDIKSSVDLFLLNGVNHIFYHGTSYSPPNEPWPGWLFYAAVHLNPRNPEWNNFHALNEYVARTQSFLQNSKAANDVLLYYPIADPMSQPNEDLIVHFDGIGKQFEGSVFEEAAWWMMQNGYTYDFISDKQIAKLEFLGVLATAGGANYKTIVVPFCEYIPVETLDKLGRLASYGVKTIFYKGFPKKHAGLKALQFDDSIHVIHKQLERIPMAIQSNNLQAAFNKFEVKAEELAQHGYEFTRRSNGTQTIYFVRSVSGFDGWTSINAPGKSITFFDPLSGQIGTPAIKDGKFRLKTAPLQTMIIVADTESTTATPFNYLDADATPLLTLDNWNIRFDSGGPTLPAELKNQKPGSWTLYNSEEYQSFSGTAFYTTTFEVKSAPEGLLLDLGEVRESAEIWLNGKLISTLIAPPFRVKIEQSMVQTSNTLEIRVTNLMANRIADLDRRSVVWKRFYNINFPSRKPENRKDGIFDASHWMPAQSGLLGPVRFLPIK